MFLKAANIYLHSWFFHLHSKIILSLLTNYYQYSSLISDIHIISFKLFQSFLLFCCKTSWLKYFDPKKWFKLSSGMFHQKLVCGEISYSSNIRVVFLTIRYRTENIAACLCYLHTYLNTEIADTKNKNQTLVSWTKEEVNKSVNKLSTETNIYKIFAFTSNFE